MTTARAFRQQLSLRAFMTIISVFFIMARVWYFVDCGGGVQFEATRVSSGSDADRFAVTLRSHSNRELRVLEIRANCSCLQIEDSGPMAIEPNGVKVVTVELHKLRVVSGTVPGIYVILDSVDVSASFVPIGGVE